MKSPALSRPTKRSEQIARLAGKAPAGRNSIFLKVIGMNSSFDKWQADYAAHGVATFPVDANKRPMVSR